MSDPIPLDGIHLLRTLIVHRDRVRLGMLALAQELERRSLNHDLSKLGGDEFAGFSRINRAAREHPYGSPEYRAGMAQEKPTVELHYSRNSHHPEFHRNAELDATDPRVNIGGERLAESMGFFDLLEMVCDWRAAQIAYSTGTWEDGLAAQRRRYDGWFTEAQWWLIDQVAAYLAVAP